MKTMTLARITLARIATVLLLAASTQLFAQDAQDAAQDAASDTAQDVDTTESAARGKVFFERYGCYQCHQYSGSGYQGTPGGAVLTPMRFPVDAFLAYIRNPPQPNRMPPYTAKVLSDAEARDIHAFITALPQPRPKEEIEVLNSIIDELRSSD